VTSALSKSAANSISSVTAAVLSITGAAGTLVPQTIHKRARVTIDETTVLETTFSTDSHRMKNLTALTGKVFRARPLVLSVSVPHSLMRLLKIK
jgi:hypothetical protein